jgi:molybdopterin/thiamine biosynthesis adenylyltransferase
MEYPRIKPIYPKYQLNEECFRIGAQLGITTEFEDSTKEFWTLTNKLTGDRKVEDIVLEMQREYPHLTDTDILDGINLLNEQGVLEEAYAHEEIEERYLANVNYFSRFTDVSENRFNYQRKLNQSTILLLGLGGGGSNILTLLAGLGVKKIKIVDYDRVEVSNLGRQFIYKESDVNRLKNEVAKESILAMNPNIQVESYNKKIVTVEDVLSFTEDVDLVICAIDEPPFVIHRIVNQAIVQANLPCVFGASQVSRGRVYTVIPHQTGCFDCMNLNFSKNDPKFIEQFVGFRNIKFNPPSIAYGPAMFQLTASIVDEVVRVLTGYTTPRSLGTQYEINYEDGSSFTHPSWAKFEDCPTCGKGDFKEWEIFQYYEPIEENHG